MFRRSSPHPPQSSHGGDSRSGLRRPCRLTCPGPSSAQPCRPASHSRRSKSRTDWGLVDARPQASSSLPAAAAILSGLPGLGYGRMVQVAISKLFLLLGKVGATDDPYADLLSQSLRGRSENGAAHEYRWLRATPGCTLSFQPVAAFPENVTLAWR